MIQRILAKVADKDVVVTVVVKIADAHSLSPTRSGEPGFRGHVSESAVAVIVIEMICGCLAGGHPIKPSPVDQDDVFPSVIVVINEACPATSGFKQIPVAMLVPINGRACQTRFSRYVNEANPEIAVR